MMCSCFGMFWISQDLAGRGISMSAESRGTRTGATRLVEQINSVNAVLSGAVANLQRGQRLQDDVDVALTMMENARR